MNKRRRYQAKRRRLLVKREAAYHHRQRCAYASLFANSQISIGIDPRKAYTIAWNGTLTPPYPWMPFTALGYYQT